MRTDAMIIHNKPHLWRTSPSGTLSPGWWVHWEAVTGLSDHDGPVTKDVLEAIETWLDAQLIETFGTTVLEDILELGFETTEILMARAHLRARLHPSVTDENQEFLTSCGDNALDSIYDFADRNRIWIAPW